MPPIGQSEVILARQWLAELCAVETTSGQEDALLPTVQRFLAEIAPAALPVTTLLQPVAPGRTNVLALWGQPRVLLTTHLDTVPPFVPPRWDGRRCLGRGTCDAKGQIVAQWLAIRRLVTDGPGNVAWLGVVGEETDSLGAATAAADPEWRSRFEVCRAVINGEPTELKLATGQRGLERFILTCQGQAAHSGLPELGRSALWMLFDWLHDLRQEAAAVDPVLGPEIWNLGRCRGGEAANTIPAQAEAEERAAD
ncbi:MAG TPA: M20/M25/M40 family metallo-hydrolase, partial [Gemmatales bacterium]|nr:M20/M25/M40 family metallo-hydrolase [Gemmatales bacterium]